MPWKDFPGFETPTTAELRGLWRQHNDPALRQLLLEIVIVEMERSSLGIHNGSRYRRH
jgi:hypothetical protein